MVFMPKVYTPIKHPAMKFLRISRTVLGIWCLCACTALPPGADVVIDASEGVGVLAVRLGAALPLALPLVVEETDLRSRNRIGHATESPSYYRIQVDTSLTDLEKAMVFVHEYAHLLAHEAGAGQETPHGVEWGEAYARVYRAWIGVE